MPFPENDDIQSEHFDVAASDWPAWGGPKPCRMAYGSGNPMDLDRKNPRRAPLLHKAGDGPFFLGYQIHSDHSSGMETAWRNRLQPQVYRSVPRRHFPLHFRSNMSSILNFCQYSPWYLASVDFSLNPEPIELQGVRRENHFLFARLNQIPDSARRGEIFNDYMSVKFHLHEWAAYPEKAGRSLRNNYLRFLRGWGIGSNSLSGAVLKRWVESRFGIPPTFHCNKLDRSDPSSYERYWIDHMKGSALTSALFSQFDLVYEYCQYELALRECESNKLVLYRGTHDPEEYTLIGRNHDREICVRLNNLSSFTSNRERAWEFGSTVWRTHVPKCKIFFYSGLLPDSLLKGEDEYLVIGGDFWVTPLLF